MFAVLKKELKTYYTSFFTYLYYTMFFLVVGLLFAFKCLSTYSTQFGYYVLSRAFIVIAVVIPFCTMRLLAQERKNRTDQLLFTAPLSTLDILAGKYLATAIVVLLPVVLSGLYPVYIAAHGEMSFRLLSGVYLAVILISFVLLSIGMFISSVTSNIIVAALLSYAVYAVILFGRIIENLVAIEKIKDFIHNISIYNKFNDMVSGIVRSGDIIYLVFLTVIFFLFTWIVLEGRRKQEKEFFVKTGIVILGMLVISALGMQFTKVWDFTAEKVLTFSSQTEEIVSSVEKPTDIYYIGDKSRINATYLEFFNKYSRLNDNINIYYKDVNLDKEFQEKYFGRVMQINEASVLVVCGDKYIYLDSADYITTVWTSKYSYKSLLEIENQLTSAIYYTNSELSEEISVVKGHEEESFNGDFYNTLLVNNYELKSLNLSDAMLSFKETFSDQCKAVIINAPQKDYTKEEIEVLEKYLSEGGRLFVSIDPLNEDLENLYTFLKKYGFDIQRGVVIEKEDTNYVYETPYYLLPDMENSKFTDSLIKDKYQVLTMTSKGILCADTADGYKITELLTSSADSYSKVEDFDHLSIKGENDISGPFSIAAYSEHPSKGAIALITSNLFFNSDVESDSMGANQRFFLNIINGLTGNETAVCIEGKDISSQAALYPNAMRTFVEVVAIILIPLLIFIVGIAVIILRNKNINLNSLIKDRVKKDESEK